MVKAELVFIPSPGAGHLVSTVEMAKLLVHRDHRLSITILVMQLPFDSKVTYLPPLSPPNNNINFVHLHKTNIHSPTKSSSRINLINSFIESHKPQVKESVTKLLQSESGFHDSPRLVGFVLDMFCTSMIEVADEFRVPSYIFYTSSAAFLGMVFYAQELCDEQNKLITELKDSDTELMVPSLVNPFPVRVLPTVLLEQDWAMAVFEQARRFKRVKGILVNTSIELESYAVSSLSDGKINIPPLYTVGPILNLKGDDIDLTKSEIMEWLDHQPQSSVVFLCFGSMGSFGDDQVKEIASALEQSGHRFLWSLRRPPSKGQISSLSDYTDLSNVLPEGFLDRTAEIGKIIGWAPQVDVLAHKAVGGFVSHCGWNSMLESIFLGVPVGTWPMYAEQQLNAFEMVVELGLAVEIKMDYRKEVSDESEMIVSAKDIEMGIRKLMEGDNEIRKKLKEMSEKCRKALMEGGSSFSSLGCFIDDVMNNFP